MPSAATASNSSTIEPIGNSHTSDLLASMAEGIGDLTFASSEWVEAAREVLAHDVAKHSDGLSNLGTFTFCEVAHNPPAYLNCGPSLAWHAKFKDSSVVVACGELADDECDYKIEGDHSIISNIARILYHNRDPKVVAAAQARLNKLSKWKITGKTSANRSLSSVLRTLHDTMAPRTMPRFVFMTPEWVSTARYILSTRASSEKYAQGIKSVKYVFSEEFTDTPRYAFPDGAHGGFWVNCDNGQITVGAGPLPKELEPADQLTKGYYTPIVPVGRTVNAAMTDIDNEQQDSYRKAAFRYDKVAKQSPVTQSSPSEKGSMPVELSRIFMPLHDELSKRTSGELPADFDNTIKLQWATPQSFDRRSNYDASWLRYDKVDIYGNKIA